MPQAVRFDMRERRDTGIVTAKITPTSNIDLSTTFRTQNHDGELPWGASFGFSNDVEVALPYTSRTNDFSLGAEWNNSRNMFRVAYDGSWFENEDDTLVWDSPLRLDDSATLPGRGRMSMWPSNQSQTVSAAGYTKLARRTQLTGFLSYGAWTNDSTLQPFTINSALPVLALPRPTTEAEAQVFSTNLSLVSRPIDTWRFSGRLRVYDFENETPAAAIPQFINYDTSVATTHSGGPSFLSHNRTTFTADATWTGLPPLALAVGYTRNHNGYDYRIYEKADEDVLSLTADAVGLSWATVRANLEFADRTGSGLDEESLAHIGEQPAMRHYDIANRQRRKLSAQIELFPTEALSATVSAGFGNDDYEESYFGLQEAAFRGRRVRRRLSALHRHRRRRQLQLRALHRVPHLALRQPRRAGCRSAARLDDRFDRERPLLLLLHRAAAHRPRDGSAVQLRLLERPRPLRLRPHARQPADAAGAAAGGVQPPAGAARRGPPSPLAQSRRDRVVYLRAVQGL